LKDYNIKRECTLDLVLRLSWELENCSYYF
jgi:hypothetical protein